MPTSTLPVTSTGMIQTGPGAFLNSSNINDAGRAMAANYQATKDSASNFNTTGGGLSSPTVMTDANIRENAIPSTISKANGLLGPTAGVVTNTGNGTNTGSQGTDTSGNSGAGGSYAGDAQSFYDSISGMLSPDNENTQGELSLIDNMRTAGDQNFQSSLGVIKSQYQNRQNQIQQNQSRGEANLRGALATSGALRYSPISSQGILTSAEQGDIQALSDLDTKEQQAEVAARQAQNTNDYQLLGKRLDILQGLRDKKIDLATSVGKSMLEENQKQRDTTNTNLAAAKKDATDTALKNGAPKSVLDAIATATHPEDVYSAVAGYGGNANRDVIQLDNGDGTKSSVLIDKTTGNIVKWIGGGNTGGSSGSGGTSTTSANSANKDFLIGRTPEQAAAFNSLSSLDQSNVKQLVNGDALLSDLVTTKGAAGTQQRQKLLEAAQKVDPTFNENTNKIRYAFMQKWLAPDSTVGKTNIAINTALGHLADVSSMSSKLTPDDLGIINKTKNWWNAQTGNSNITNLQFGLTQLATEIATAYKGGQPGESEIEAEKAVLGTQFSKSQFKGVFNTAAQFLSSKITAQRYAYKSTMGKEYSQSLIDPDKRQALIDSGINPDSLIKENTPGTDSIGTKVTNALNSVNPATNAKYTAQDVLGHLKDDPTYGPKIEQALAKGVSAEDIVNYLKNL